jgi:hypothetical protein
MKQFDYKIGDHIRKKLKSSIDNIWYQTQIKYNIRYNLANGILWEITEQVNYQTSTLIKYNSYS